MAASQKDRSTASRIRRRIKAKTASGADVQWLEEYKRNRKPRGGFGNTRKARPKSGFATSTAEREREAKTETTEVPDTAPPEVDPKREETSGIQRFKPAAQETDAAELDSESDQDDDEQDDDETAECTITDCPCKHKGGTYCPNLDKKIYPPMSKRGAQAMSASGLGIVAGLIAFGVRVYVKVMYGKQARWVDCVQAPKQKEIDELGEDLTKIAMRRANVLGAVDDLLAAAYSTAGFAVRAGAEGAREASAGGVALGSGTPQQPEKAAPPARAPVAPSNGEEREQPAAQAPATDPAPDETDAKTEDKNVPVGSFA